MCSKNVMFGETEIFRASAKQYWEFAFYGQSENLVLLLKHFTQNRDFSPSFVITYFSNSYYLSMHIFTGEHKKIMFLIHILTPSSI